MINIMNSFYTLKPLLQIKPEHLQRLTLNSVQAVSMRKKVYPHCVDQVGFRNGFAPDMPLN